MVQYILEIANATNPATGTYKWGFGTRNEIRPKSITVGPCSVSMATDQRQVTVLSDSFRNAGRTHTFRGDVLDNVLTVVHPYQKHKNVISTTTEDGVSDADVLALDDLYLFVDWDYAGEISPNPISDGDNISSITSRLNGNHVFNTSIADGLEYSSFGETNAMLSTVANHTALDGSTNNTAEGDAATLTMMFRTKAVLTGWNWIYKSSLFNITVGQALSSASQMGFFSSQDVAWGTTSLDIEAATDYLLQVRKTGDSFVWLLRNLTTEVEQTETTVDTTTTGIVAAIGLSDTQTGFEGLKISHVIEVLNVTDAAALSAKNWMIQKWSGTPASSTVTSTTYQLYDPRTTHINMARPADVLREITLEFQDHDGAAVAPSAGTIHLSVQREKNGADL